RQASGAHAVTVLSQLPSLPVLAACVVLVARRGPTAGALAWGALAGSIGFVGILLLYHGLSQGAMAVFAPVTAVTTAVVPLAAGLAIDGIPSTPALVGAGCAVVAIALVSRAPGERRVSTRTVALALTAGTCFGVFFVILGRAGPAAGIWPLVGVRLGSVATGLAVAARMRGPVRLDRVA